MLRGRQARQELLRRAAAEVAVDQRKNRMAQTWRKETGSVTKRLLRAIITRHPLLSAILHHGAGTLTRAQTIFVFLNSISLQLVIVSMLFVPRQPGEPMTINPFKIVVSGTLAAVITMPCVFVFGFIFHPLVLLWVTYRLTTRLAGLFVGLPCILGRRVRRRRPAAPSDEHRSRYSERKGPKPSWGMGTSMQRDINLLKGAAPRMAMHAADDDGAEKGTGGQATQPKARYSVTRLSTSALRYAEERKKIWSLVVGYVLNFLLLLLLLQLFLIYACEFATLPGVDDTHLIQRELLFAWLWSVVQRIILNEPLLIITSRGLPILLQSSLCACLCSEAMVEYASHFIEAFAAMLKELVSP